MITCIAIDDEPIALSIIRKFCEKRGGISLETYSMPRRGMQRVLETHPDVVMLDIEMNGINGIELARQLPDTCCLIFTTAYAHYAVEGFEVNAVDFLHKPFFYERFEKAMTKAERWIVARDLITGMGAEKKVLVVKSEYRNVSIPTDLISYVESLENYICIHKIDGTKVKSKLPLHVVENMLPTGDFVRIHRSYIVARKRVVGFNNSEVSISGESRPLPIGKKYAEGFRTAMSHS